MTRQQRRHPEQANGSRGKMPMLQDLPDSLTQVASTVAKMDIDWALVGTKVRNLLDNIPQPISRKAHGVADYSYVSALAAAPHVFKFREDKVATNLARVIAAGILAQGLMTKAEWGLFKVMPYKRHLQMDVAVGLFGMMAPWVFGFAKNSAARNTFLVAGLVSFLAGAMSRPEEMVGHTADAG